LRGWTYILAGKRNGTLYVGATSNLRARIQQHRDELLPGFTSRYAVKLLVYFEEHALVAQAIQREGNIKHWPRKWKLALIERVNPEWRDLGDELHLL
jgi:putative endonuclease